MAILSIPLPETPNNKTMAVMYDGTIDNGLLSYLKNNNLINPVWLNGNNLIEPTDYDIPLSGLSSDECKAIDSEFYIKYSDYDISERLINMGFNTRERIINIIASILLNHDYELNKLYTTMYLAYNPLFNVDGTETIERDYGQREDTYTKGQRIDTTQLGQRQSSENTPQIIVTNERKDSDATYQNGDSYKARTKSEFTETTPSHIITNTQNTATDTMTEGAQVNSNITKTHRDTETNTRKGNIGVTSSQKLMEEERKIALFNFEQKIYDIIIDSIGVKYWR